MKFRSRAYMVERVVTGALTLGITAGAEVAEAQEPATPTQRVLPATRYQAGGFHRMLFGTDYRALWTTPIEAEVLDIRTYEGGLTPTETGGGQQTLSLRFVSADGRPFTFRSLDKDPSAVLDPDLQGTFAADLVQDQISSSHPTAALVVDKLLDAAGILHSPPRLVVFPDDMALGQFREAFAGKVGMLEQWPNVWREGQPGFAGATEIVSTDELESRMDAGPDDRVDVNAYLTARLLDIVIGDWDRHRGQWRWARFGEARPHVWKPIPEDRDQAFARFDGLMLSIARIHVPQLVKYGPKAPTMLGMTWNGRDVDRRLLAGVPWPTWDSVAQALQAKLTDGVIDEAVRRLPESHYRLDGTRLAATIKERRDQLPEIARRFYRHLTSEVDIRLTDRGDSLQVTRAAESLDVAAYLRGGGSEPYFRRRFASSETNAVRVYLIGGDDRVAVSGDGGGPLLRVIAGPGTDQVTDQSARGGTRVYDSEGAAGVQDGPGLSVNRRAYTPPPLREGEVAPRDWGTRLYPTATLGFASDVGAFIGGGFVFRRHGFRTFPYKRQHTFSAGYATDAQTFRVEYEADFRRMNSDVHFTFRALASGIEIVRFHGFGNETTIIDDTEFYRVKQEQYIVEPMLHLPAGPQVTVSFGPVLKYASSDLDPTRFIGVSRPYGASDFGQIGGKLSVTVDTRDITRAARSGVLLRAAASYYPSAWDVDSGGFGEVHGQLATYLSPVPEATLALRVGGKKVWGTFPFQEAAFLGGRSTVRGFEEQRFAGDGSVYGNAELRLYVSRFYFLLPGDFGIFGLADAGRVYLDGENSDEWHSAFGGGIWFAYLDRKNTLSVAVARSDERTGVYFRAGFIF